MWERYKRTAPAVQTTIVLATVAIYFLSGRQLGTAGIAFVGMQICAIWGAMWGERLVRKVKSREDGLPLERRLK